MENYSPDAVRKTFQLFLELVEKTSVKKSEKPDLYNSYDDSEVTEIMGIFEEAAEVMLLRSSDSIYLTPKAENRFFGFNNEELRKSMSLANNTELYGAYIVILSIMIKFYNGENYNVKNRTLLKVEELEAYITTRLQAFSEKEDGVQEEDRLGFNFAKVAKLWIELPAYDEKITQYARSTGTRISIIYKTLGFLKEQGFVLLDNNEIFTTEKFDIMATAYYPENHRKKELLDYLDQLATGGNQNA